MAVDLSGTILSERYRVLHLIGDGGMGRVYAAEHITLRRRMAIKVLREELGVDESNVDRFLQEAQAASAINHENVVDITDFGRTPTGSVFFVMEFLEGEELASLMHREAPMPWTAAQPIILQVVRGLNAAHERGVIHRDMKPANIFLACTDRGDTKVKLLDFGIAKLQREGRRPHTRRGSVFGTARYMSPEQAAGRDVDRRSDIYAVGVVLYEMLTGHAPFESDNFMEVVAKHINDPIVPPRQLAPNAGIPEAVEDLVMRALAKDPNDRYPNMAEFEAAIQSASFESTVATVNPLLADNIDRTIVWDAERGRRAREAASLGYAAASGYGGADPYAGAGTPGIHRAPAPAANEQTVIRPRPVAMPGRARFSGRNNYTPLVSVPPPPPMQHIGVNHPTFPPPARGAGPIVRAGEGAFFASSSMAQAEGEGGRFAAVLPTGADVPASEPVEHRTLPPVNWIGGPNPITAEHGANGHEGVETAEFALNVPRHAPSRNLLVILVAAIAVLCIVGGVTAWALFFNDDGVVEEEIYATVVTEQPRPAPVEVEPIEPAEPAKTVTPREAPEPARIEVGRLEEEPRARNRGGLGRTRKSTNGFGGARAAISACGRQHGAIEGTSLRITFDVIGGRASSVSVQRPYSVTPLGRCVANAISTHARFPGADAPGQTRRVEF